MESKNEIYNASYDAFNLIKAYVNIQDTYHEYELFMKRNLSDEEVTKLFRDKKSEFERDPRFKNIPSRVTILVVAGFNYIEAVLYMLRHAELSNKFNRVLALDRTITFAYNAACDLYLSYLDDFSKGNDSCDFIHSILKATRYARDMIAAENFEKANWVLRFIEHVEGVCTEVFKTDEFEDEVVAWGTVDNAMFELLSFMTLESGGRPFSEAFKNTDTRITARYNIDHIESEFNWSKLGNVLSAEEIFFVMSLLYSARDIIYLTGFCYIGTMKLENIDILMKSVADAGNIIWRCILNKKERKVLTPNERESLIEYLTETCKTIENLLNVVTVGVLSDSSLVAMGNIPNILRICDYIIKDSDDTNKEEKEMTGNAGDWEALNEAIGDLTDAFILKPVYYAENQTVSDAFFENGDKATKACQYLSDKLDNVENKLVEFGEDILSQQEYDFIESGISIFRWTLSVSKLPCRSEFNQNGIEILHISLAATLSQIWLFISEELGFAVIDGNSISTTITNLTNFHMNIVHYANLLANEARQKSGWDVPCEMLDAFLSISDEWKKKMAERYERTLPSNMDKNSEKEKKEEETNMSGETTTEKSTWEQLNAAIDRFTKAFNEPAMGDVTLYSAFAGDKDTYELYVHEIDLLEEAINREDVQKDLLNTDELAFMLLTIGIFREFMDLSQRPFARRFEPSSIESFHEEYVRSFWYAWEALSEEAGYIFMTDAECRALARTIQNRRNELGQCDYAINQILAGYCESLTYENLDVFYNDLGEIASRLEGKTSETVEERQNASEEKDSTIPEEDHEDVTGTVFDDMIELLRGYGDHNFTEADEKFKFCVDGLCTEMIDNMFHNPTSTGNLGFEQWLSVQVIGISQELFLLRDVKNKPLLGELCNMLADILHLLVKAGYYPNIPQRKFHLPEFNIHVVSKREIVKLKDTSMYVLNHMIYELDEACGIDVAKTKGSCFIHISEFAHYGLTCAARMEKMLEMKDTVRDLKEVANIEGRPIITAQQGKPMYDPREDPEWDPSWEDDEDDPESEYDPDDDDNFKEGHDQMLMYAKLRKDRAERERSEMEEWLMNCKEPVEPVAILPESIDRLKDAAKRHTDSIRDIATRLSHEESSKKVSSYMKDHIRGVRKMLRRASKKGKK